MFPLRSADAAYNKISGMLATLGDPFTRIISPKVPFFYSSHPSECFICTASFGAILQKTFVHYVCQFLEVEALIYILLYHPFSTIWPQLLWNLLCFFVLNLGSSDFNLQEYQSFRIGSDGNLRGVGLFINVDPKSGHLVCQFNFSLHGRFLCIDCFNQDLWIDEIIKS